MNAILTSLFSAVMAPLKGLDPAWSMVILSLVTGVAMLVAFRYVSNQRGIKRSKARVISELLAIRLFKDDPWMTIKCLGAALKSNLFYLRYMLTPLVVLLVPVVLLLIQMEQWYGSEPLTPGQTTRVALALDKKDDVAALDAVKLLPATDDSYAVESPAMRIPALGEVNWRIRAKNPGDTVLRFEVGGKPVEKRLAIAAPDQTDLSLVSTTRVGSGFFDAVLHPAESTIGGTVASVSVDHHARPFSIFGIEMAWWLAFFILSLVFAFALKGPLGIQA